MMDLFYHYIAGKVIFVVLTKYFEVHYQKAVVGVFSVALCKEIYDHLTYDASILDSIKDIIFTMFGVL